MLPRHTLAFLLMSPLLHGCGEPDADVPNGSDPPSTVPDAAPATIDAAETADAPADDASPPRDTEPSTTPAPDPVPIPDPAPATSSTESPTLDTPTSFVPDTATPSDCAATLPCTLALGDGPLVVTLHAADGEALDGSGPLRVDFVAESRSRDATVAIERSSSVVASGQVLEADALQLGLPSAPGASDEASFALVAGVPINGHATFAGTLIGNPATLDRVALRLGEAGRTFEATFANVPLGAEPSAPVDCANTLPCEWRPDDATVTLALTDAAPLRWNNATRLAVSFSIGSTRPLELALLPSGRVTNGAGETLEPYGIEIGADSSHDGTPLLHPLGAGERVAGRLVPRRAPEEGETSLASVELPLVERRSPRAPRWRPVFLNVPLNLPASDD